MRSAKARISESLVPGLRRPRGARTRNGSCQREPGFNAGGCDAATPCTYQPSCSRRPCNAGGAPASSTRNRKRTRAGSTRGRSTTVPVATTFAPSSTDGRRSDNVAAACSPASAKPHANTPARRERRPNPHSNKPPSRAGTRLRVDGSEARCRHAVQPASNATAAPRPNGAAVSRGGGSLSMPASIPPRRRLRRQGIAARRVGKPPARAGRGAARAAAIRRWTRARAGGLHAVRARGRGVARANGRASPAPGSSPARG